MRVAVTGASGFVGGAVCRQLRAAGWQPHAFGRRRQVDPEHVAGAPYRSWDLTRGPLPDPPDVDAVVHAGAFVADVDDGDVGRTARAEAVNVTGTGHVLDTWPRARFVQVSSASVYHPDRAQRSAREADAPDPATVRWPNGYGRSKARAEQLVAARRPEAIVLRPHAVYGPGDTTLMPRLLAAVRAGVLLLPGSGRQRHALTRIDNLTQACLLACTAPGSVNGAFNVTDAEPVLLAEALAEALAARGRAVRVVPIGERPARALAAVSERLQRRPVLSRYAAGHLALERTFDLSRARDLLGYCPGSTELGDAAGW